jgi:hypothetical protein
LDSQGVFKDTLGHHPLILRVASVLQGSASSSTYFRRLTEPALQAERERCAAYIGGSVAARLIGTRERYEVLSGEIGVTPVLGSHDNDEVLIREARASDGRQGRRQ